MARVGEAPSPHKVPLAGGHIVNVFPPHAFEEAPGVRVPTVATDMEVTVAAEATELHGAECWRGEGAQSSSQEAQGTRLRRQVVGRSDEANGG